MRIQKIALLGALVMMIGTATMASAATITISFLGGSDQLAVPSLALSFPGGLGVTMSPGTGTTDDPTSTISRYAATGLGVNTGGVDNLTTDEFVKFVFNQPVTVASIFVAQSNLFPDTRYQTDGNNWSSNNQNTSQTSNLAPGVGSCPAARCTELRFNAAVAVANILRFGPGANPDPIGNSAGRNDSFMVYAMTLDYTPVTSPVPEPGTLSLLSLGLLGTVVVRLRLKR